MKRLLPLLLVILLTGCQKDSIDSKIEGVWKCSVSAHWQSIDYDNLVLTLYGGEVTFHKERNVKYEEWQDGFGTYTVEGSIITFDIEMEESEKSPFVNQLHYAEILEEEYSTRLKVFYAYEGCELPTEYAIFSR